MTNREALGRLQNVYFFCRKNNFYCDKECSLCETAKQMAIEALELAIAIEDGGEIIPKCR